MKNALCLIFYFLFLGSFVLGQTNLDEVVVSSPRLSIPFSEDSKSVTVITAKQMANMPATSLADVLRLQAGVDVLRQGMEGANADIYLRGGTYSQVLLLIDGIRVDDPQTGHHTLNSALPLDVIERIEIVKGPAARIYGQNAFTGAINIVTKNATSNKTNFAMAHGSFGSNQVSLTEQIQTEKQQHTAHFSLQESDGYRHNTDFKNLHVFTKSSFAAGASYINVLTMFTERKFGANGFYRATTATEQYEETQSSLVALTTTLASEDQNWRLSPRLFWKRGQDEYIYIRDNPSVFRNLHITNRLGTSLDVKNINPWGVTGFGLEFSRVNIQSNNLGDKSRTIAHLFFEHRFTTGAFDITPGFAWSNYSDMGGFFYPGFDMGYRLSERVKLTYNTGYTYRIPTYTDLFYQSKTTKGNADLQPEKALSHEISMRYEAQQWFVEAAVFQRDGENLIDFVKQSPSDEAWVAENIAEQIRTIGGELNAVWKYRIGKQQHTLNLSYAYLQDDYIKTVYSKYALNFLKHDVNAQLTKQFSPSFSSTVSYRYATRALGDTYQLFNLQLNYTLSSKWNIELQGRNLFDVTYYENLIPMPKANGIVSLRYTL
jgi:iron complex outermembrane receptor protein